MFDTVDTNIPEYTNWFEDGTVSAPLEQMQGSWAQTSASVLESLAAINGLALKSLSAQQLIDCDHTNAGLEGGWMHKAFAYTSKYGLMTSEDYPYTGKQAECMYDSEKVAFKNVGITQEKLMSNEKLKSLVAKQPVAVGMVANENLRFYQSGIITEEFLKCNSENA